MKLPLIAMFGAAAFAFASAAAAQLDPMNPVLQGPRAGQEAKAQLAALGQRKRTATAAEITDGQLTEFRCLDISCR